MLFINTCIKQFYASAPKGESIGGCYVAKIIKMRPTDKIVWAKNWEAEVEKAKMDRDCAFDNTLIFSTLDKLVSFFL